jgi:hypothetical protein
VCEHVEVVTVAGKPARQGRLVKWEYLDPRGGRRRFVFDDGTRSESLRLGSSAPVRRGTCRISTGSGSCTAVKLIMCQCGSTKKAAVNKTVHSRAPGKLPRRAALASGSRPGGLRPEAQAAHEDGDEHLLPQVNDVISLPSAEDELTKLVDSLSSDFANVQSVQDIALVRASIRKSQDLPRPVG